MKADSRPRFDVDVLRKLAGAKVFARGEAYYRDGQVEMISGLAHTVLRDATGQLSRLLLDWLPLQAAVGGAVVR